MVTEMHALHSDCANPEPSWDDGKCHM